MMKDRTRAAVIVVALGAVFIVLMTHEQDYLVRMERQNLFLNTPLFLQQHSDSIRGLINYVACYLTQYFYRPWQGALLFCGLCGVMMWLTAMALRIPSRWSVLLLFPLAWVLIDNFSLGYRIYQTNMQGRMFTGVLNISIVMAVIWVLRLSVWRFTRLRWPVTTRKLSRAKTIVANGIIAIVLTISCYMLWYKNQTFYKELRMMNLVDQQDWEGVVDAARQQKGEQSRVIVALRNLALFKLNRAGEELFSYPNGVRKNNEASEIHLSQICGKALYLHYGIPNYCTRWCMEQGVKYGWTVDLLDYMTRSALLNQETTVAKKYIDLLDKTKYHAWKNTPEQTDILRLMDDDGFPGNDYGRTEMFLVSNLARVVTQDKKHAELAAIAAMLTKDERLFWRAFFQYTATMAENDRMPRHFQEAALLFGQRGETVDISHMPFDEKVVADYNQYMQTGWNNHTYYYYYYKTDNTELD